MDRAAESPTPFANPLQDMLAFQLRRASVAVMSALGDELAALGLKSSQATLIMLIGANPGCTQSEIGRALRAKSANLVPLINHLVTLGALQREPGHGRAIALSLSAEGKRLLVEIREVMAKIEALCSNNISDKEQALLTLSLKKVCQSACSVLR